MNIALALFKQAKEHVKELVYALTSFTWGKMNGICLCLGAFLLIVGLQGFANAASEVVYEQPLITDSYGQLYKLIEGAYSALIMVVAGIGAIVAASMRAYRLAASMLVVSIGVFILRLLVSLFFEESVGEI